MKRHGEVFLGLLGATVLVAGIQASLSPALASGTQPVRTGAEVLLDDPAAALLANKRIGLITNRSAVDGKEVPVVERFVRDTRFKLAAILTPEHGLKADKQGKIGDQADPAAVVPVHSLYGKTLKPTAEMLAGLDALVFDIPDVGARFYTFISTMRLAMEAAKEAGLPFIVLDRPNPIGGEILEGGVLETPFRSFTGPFEIPVRHGMTVGELARLFNAQIGADLRVVEMQGWRRSMWFDQTGLPWAKPSPAMVNLTTATLYPGVCFFEATQVDCRVGQTPFERIAAPWLDAERIARELTSLRLPGVEITATSIDGKAPNPYSFRPSEWWAGFPVEVTGEASVPGRAVAFRITDRQAFRPVRTAFMALSLVQKYHPGHIKIEPRGFDRLAGTDKVRTRLLAGEPADVILRDWEASLTRFEQDRKAFLIYK